MSASSKASLFADRGDEADAKILLRMWHDHMAGSTRMLEDVMRATHAIQNPTDGFHVTDEVRALHDAHNTH